jgi:beta-lactamase regulating signal transducer with metallopeptidase domain
MATSRARSSVTVVPELAGIITLGLLSLTPLLLSSGMKSMDWLFYRHWPGWSMFLFEPLQGLDTWLHWTARILIGAGIVSVVGRRVTPYLAFRRRMADGPIRLPADGTVLHRIATRYDCVASVSVLPEHHGTVAFTAGLWRPRVYISERILDALDDRQLELLLLHELQHCRSRDPFWSWLTSTLADQFFWLPAVRILEDRVMAKIEFGADDAAAALDRTGLAETILKVAGLRSPDLVPGAVPFARTSHLVSRVQRLIRYDDEPLHDPALTGGMLRSTTLVLLVLWTLGFAAYGTHHAHETTITPSGYPVP